MDGNTREYVGQVMGTRVVDDHGEPLAVSDIAYFTIGMGGWAMMAVPLGDDLDDAKSLEGELVTITVTVQQQNDLWDRRRRELSGRIAGERGER